jgi:acetylglutamate kinase
MNMVVKYGGNAMTDPAVRSRVAAVLRSEHGAERSLVVVHGGGPAIQAALDAAGITTEFVRGLRTTPIEAIPHVEAALTLLGKSLASDIGPAVALTGRDAGLLRATVASSELGRVGHMSRVDPTVLHALASRELIPVVACLALDEAGQPLNVNADEVAASVAAALNAPVVFLTNVSGLLERPDDPQSLLRDVTRRDIAVGIADGRIAGGMIPKVEAALTALDLGASYAVIADGRTPERVAAALRGSTGTRVTAD